MVLIKNKEPFTLGNANALLRQGKAVKAIEIYKHLILSDDHYVYLNYNIEIAKRCLKKDADPSLKPLLSVIIPIRVEKETEYLLDRLRSLLKALTKYSWIEVVLVDYSSNKPYKQFIKNLLYETVESDYAKRKYIYIQNKTIFSIGICRDIGAEYARGDCLIFMDVDLSFSPKLLGRLRKKIIDRKLNLHTADFFIIPCLYLSERANKKYNVNDESTYKNTFEPEMKDYNTSNPLFLNKAIVTSTLVCNRRHYLSMGGHLTQDFEGHGYEDWEMLNRFAIMHGKYPAPSNPTHITAQKGKDGVGFLSRIFKYGEDSLNNSLITVHKWHPPIQSSNYMESRKKNLTILKEKVAATYDSAHAFNTSPPPLSDKNSEINTYAFCGSQSNFAQFIRQALPYFGNIFFSEDFEAFKDENNGTLASSNIEIFLEFIRKKSICTVIINNPYGNPGRLKMYNALKADGVKVIIHERGALPETWFFDETGFNAESSRYSPGLWNKNLSLSQQEKVESYIRKIKYSQNPLEKSADYMDSRVFRREFDSLYQSEKKTVVFIALQRPNDTVIKFFSDLSNGMSTFCDLLNEAIDSLDTSQYIFIAKKHPLESEYPPGLGNKILRVDYNINNLLEVCDKVVVINSGVGLLSMIYEKPVGYFGHAFYGHPGLNTKLRSSRDLIDFVRNTDIRVDMNTAHRFIHYLSEEYYSYASSTRKSVVKSDGSRDVITTALNYSNLKLPLKDITSIQIY